MDDRVKFKVGDMVCWTSSSAGTTRNKTGRVVAVMSPGVKPQRSNFYSDQRYNHTGFGLPRGSFSFLVAVLRRGARGQSLKPTLYWPRVSALRAAAVAPMPVPGLLA